MQPSSDSRHMMDRVTGECVDWHAMQSSMERFVYPELRFDVVNDPEQYQADLILAFPSEACTVAAYFTDLRCAADWFSAHVSAGLHAPTVSDSLETRTRHSR